jgi:hypothetical protein
MMYMLDKHILYICSCVVTQLVYVLVRLCFRNNSQGAMRLAAAAELANFAMFAVEYSNSCGYSPRA